MSISIQRDLINKSLPDIQENGTAQFKNCKQLFEYQHFLLGIDIWWSKL